MKRLAYLAVVLIALTASATGLKVWVSGETPTIGDLNANFSHIHNTMVGGHGARLTNSDVATNAAIASSKLADGTWIPKYAAQVGLTSFPCATPATCTLYNTKNITSVAGQATTGTYTITLASSFTGPGVVILTCTEQNCVCTPTITSGTISTISVQCNDTATPSNMDASFSFVIFAP